VSFSAIPTSVSGDNPSAGNCTPSSGKLCAGTAEGLIGWMKVSGPGRLESLRPGWSPQLRGKPAAPRPARAPQAPHKHWPGQ